jgi:hypothetical protein
VASTLSPTGAETDAFEPLSYFVQQQQQFRDKYNGDTHAVVGLFCFAGFAIYI